MIGVILFVIMFCLVFLESGRPLSAFVPSATALRRGHLARDTHTLSMHTAHLHGALRTCKPDGAARKASAILLLRPAQAHRSCAACSL